MKVLAHIHTLNDKDVIEHALRAVLAQARPVDGILIVDNGSTDGTLDRPFPKQTTIIRHGENLGTSGAVVSGLQYGIDHRYDWVWTFDADSAPHADALEKLLALYESFSAEVRERTAWLACLPVNVHDQKPRHGLIVTPGSYVEAQPASPRAWYECDVTIWSGTLFRSEAIKRIGLPSADYMLDWGEFEYGYRVRRAGYCSFIHTESVVDHDTRGVPSLTSGRRSIGPLTVTFLDLPPIRAYYYVRNNLHFWLHEYRGPKRRSVALLRLYKCSKLMLNALLVPDAKWQMVSACARGYRDGVLGNIRNRY